MAGKGERWRRIAEEIDLNPKQEAELAQTLRAITLEAETINTPPMPANYEEYLIRSLRTKMNAQNAAKAKTAVSSGFFSKLSMPQFRLQAFAAMGIAVVAIVVGVKMGHQAGHTVASVTEGMLLEAAQVSDEALVDNWINSVSDSVAMNAHRDLASLTQEMTSDLPAHEQQKILNSFAAGEEEI